MAASRVTPAIRAPPSVQAASWRGAGIEPTARPSDECEDQVLRQAEIATDLAVERE